MTRKLYDKSQSSGPVKSYRVVDGKIVEVETIASVPVTPFTRRPLPELSYRQKHGRCEDAPCCGCCD